jgi:hypothetical protein
VDIFSGTIILKKLPKKLAEKSELFALNTTSEDKNWIVTLVLRKVSFFLQK